MLLPGLPRVHHEFNEVITDPSWGFIRTVSLQSHGLNTVNSPQSFQQARLPIKLSRPGWQQAPSGQGGQAVKVWRPAGAALAPAPLLCREQVFFPTGYIRVTGSWETGAKHVAVCLC